MTLARGSSLNMDLGARGGPSTQYGEADAAASTRARRGSAARRGRSLRSVDHERSTPPATDGQQPADAAGVSNDLDSDLDAHSSSQESLPLHVRQRKRRPPLLNALPFSQDLVASSEHGSKRNSKSAERDLPSEEAGGDASEPPRRQTTRRTGYRGVAPAHLNGEERSVARSEQSVASAAPGEQTFAVNSLVSVRLTEADDDDDEFEEGGGTAGESRRVGVVVKIVMWDKLKVRFTPDVSGVPFALEKTVSMCDAAVVGRRPPASVKSAARSSRKGGRSASPPPSLPVLPRPHVAEPGEGEGGVAASVQRDRAGGTKACGTYEESDRVLVLQNGTEYSATITKAESIAPYAYIVKYDQSEKEAKVDQDKIARRLTLDDEAYFEREAQAQASRPRASSRRKQGSKRSESPATADVAPAPKRRRKPSPAVREVEEVEEAPAATAVAPADGHLFALGQRVYVTAWKGRYEDAVCTVTNVDNAPFSYIISCDGRTFTFAEEQLYAADESATPAPAVNTATNETRGSKPVRHEAEDENSSAIAVSQDVAVKNRPSEANRAVVTSDENAPFRDLVEHKGTTHSVNGEHLTASRPSKAKSASKDKTKAAPKHKAVEAARSGREVGDTSTSASEAPAFAVGQSVEVKNWPSNANKAVVTDSENAPFCYLVEHKGKTYTVTEENLAAAVPRPATARSAAAAKPPLPPKNPDKRRPKAGTKLPSKDPPKRKRRQSPVLDGEDSFDAKEGAKETAQPTPPPSPQPVPPRTTLDANHLPSYDVGDVVVVATDGADGTFLAVVSDDSNSPYTFGVRALKAAEGAAARTVVAEKVLRKARSEDRQSPSAPRGEPNGAEEPCTFALPEAAAATRSANGKLGSDAIKRDVSEFLSGCNTSQSGENVAAPPPSKRQAQAELASSSSSVSVLAISQPVIDKATQLAHVTHAQGSLFKRCFLIENPSAPGTQVIVKVSKQKGSPGVVDAEGKVLVQFLHGVTEGAGGPACPGCVAGSDRLVMETDRFERVPAEALSPGLPWRNEVCVLHTSRLQHLYFVSVYIEGGEADEMVPHDECLRYFKVQQRGGAPPRVGRVLSSSAGKLRVRYCLSDPAARCDDVCDCLVPGSRRLVEVKGDVEEVEEWRLLPERVEVLREDMARRLFASVGKRVRAGGALGEGEREWSFRGRGQLVDGVVIYQALKLGGTLYFVGESVSFHYNGTLFVGVIVEFRFDSYPRVTVDRLDTNPPPREHTVRTTSYRYRVHVNHIKGVVNVLSAQGKAPADPQYSDLPTYYLQNGSAVSSG